MVGCGLTLGKPGSRHLEGEFRHALQEHGVIAGNCVRVMKAVRCCVVALLCAYILSRYSTGRSVGLESFLPAGSLRRR